MSTATGMDSFTARWKINDMEYGLHGVVHTVHWSCIAGILEDGSDYVTTNGVTQLQNISYDSDDFIEFGRLTEDKVLEWVKEQMQEKWEETEENIVSAWEDTKWNKENKERNGLPWTDSVPRSDEEQEPGWVQAALDGIEEDGGKVFEPLDMPVDDDEFATDVGQWRHEGVNDEFRDSRVALTGNTETSEEDEVEDNPETDSLRVSFGNNLDDEEE